MYFLSVLVEQNKKGKFYDEKTYISSQNNSKRFKKEKYYGSKE